MVRNGSAFSDHFFRLDVRKGKEDGAKGFKIIENKESGTGFDDSARRDSGTDPMCSAMDGSYLAVA